MDFYLIMQLVFLGCTVGFLAGLFGVGGGGIMVPVFTSIFITQGIPIDKVLHIALGTSMASIVVTSIASCHAHHKNNNILWPEAKILSMGVIVGAFSATYIVSSVHSVVLAVFFTLYMAYASFFMLRGRETNQSKKALTNRNMIIAGTGIGSISSLVSIGGGSMTVPYLMKHGFSIKKAIGTSAAIGMPLSLAGSVGFLINGDASIIPTNQVIGFIHWPSVLIISIFTASVAPLGANLANRLPLKILKKLFGLLLILFSIEMLFHVLSSIQ